jgi:peptidoglycan/LPS O-acetylase OafA/YrhL
LVNVSFGIAYWVAGMMLAEILVKNRKLISPQLLLKSNIWWLRALMVGVNVLIYILYQKFKFPFTSGYDCVIVLLFYYTYREIRETKFSPFLINIGIFSYSLYLFHQPIMQLVNILDTGFATHISAFTFVRIACYLPYIMLEKPSIMFIQNWQHSQRLIGGKKCV